MFVTVGVVCYLLFVICLSCVVRCLIVLLLAAVVCCGCLLLLFAVVVCCLLLCCLWHVCGLLFAVCVLCVACCTLFVDVGAVCCRLIDFNVLLACLFGCSCLLVCSVVWCVVCCLCFAMSCLMRLVMPFSMDPNPCSDPSLLSLPLVACPAAGRTSNVCNCTLHWLRPKIWLG